jgi:hypothetical protein
MSFGMTRPAAKNLAGVLDKDIARKTALPPMRILFRQSNTLAVEDIIAQD